MFLTARSTRPIRPSIGRTRAAERLSSVYPAVGMSSGLRRLCRVTASISAPAYTRSAHAHIQVSPGLGLEAGVPDLVACLSQVGAVREQLEQGRGPPGAAHIGRERGRADSVDDPHVSRE